MPNLRRKGCIAAAIAGLIVAAPLLRCVAADAPGAKPKKPDSPIEATEVAIRKFTVAPGLKVDLFAAEPDVRNPVSLSIDEQGRVFVVESDRRRSSVIDIRWHMEWLEADLSFRTVQDRSNFLKREVVPSNKAVIDRLTKPGQGGFRDFNKDGILDWHDLEVQSERIRLLEDTDGDGRADRARVFADGFTNLIAGVAAGVLARHGDVYFACIPDLWRIRSSGFRVSGSELDTPPATRNPELETRNLISGFGVHIAFGGHDMHGLIFGPDGKLYWSIADRGTDTNLFAKIRNPIPGLTPELLADSGCIFRANADGSDFEVVAWGLRNPQELAFDEFGNLFTADNNGDGGDKARWHYVVEGADFGWRIGWQWLEARAYQPKMGPWNGERLWHLAESNTAAYLLPPIAHIGHGPAGLAYNPGTGLPAQFDRHFFLCDFPGHVLMWTNIPDGASFKIGPVKNFFGDLGPTDVAFHPDGGVLVSDWFKSFDKSDKGRIYRIHDPETDQSAAVQETKRLLADGMEGRSVKELAELLGHADMRVRLEAQWEMGSRALANPFAFRGREVDELFRLALSGTNLFSRLHAMRALGPVVWRNSGDTNFRSELELRPLLTDGNAEIRAEAVKLFWVDAEWRSGWITASFGSPARLLSDPSPRVRLFGTMAIAKVGTEADLKSLVDVLRSEAGRDPYMVHAISLAIARLVPSPAFARLGYKSPPIMQLANDPSPRVRLAFLLGLRRVLSSAKGVPPSRRPPPTFELGPITPDLPNEIARFLSDPDPQLVLEAARAINNVPIPAAYPQLAAYAVTYVPPPEVSSPNPRYQFEAEMRFFILRRALNANFRLGYPTNAQALATFAARSNLPEPLRIEALELLSEWPKPPGRDHFLGVWRPLPPRDAAPAADALRPVVASLLQSAPKDVRLAAMRTAAALGVKEADFFGIVSDASQSPELRVEALKALAEQQAPHLADALKLARADQNESVRIEAARLQGGAGDAAPFARILENGSLAEKQNAFASLATAPGGTADELLIRQLDALLDGKLALELQCDVLEAAAKRKNSVVKQKLSQFEAALPKNDPLAPYRPVLHGGNAENGKKLFIENQQIACFRCHKINGEGGEVGPELTGIGAKKSPEQILEAIVFPNKEVAAGFENVLIDLKNGASYAGLVKSETDAELVLNSPEDGILTLKKSDLKTRQRGLSAMPEALATYLTRRELRDLIEFLASAK